MTQGTTITKKITRLKITIAVLLALLLIAVYFVIVHNSRDAGNQVNFTEGAPNKLARDHIEYYRDTWGGSIYDKTQFIVYTPEQLKVYIDSIFPAITAKLTLVAGYQWTVGFYMIRRPNQHGKPRNSFFVVPTMMKVNGRDTTFLDYFDKKSEYKMRGSANVDDDTLAFDSGHLYP
jgi:hypothetical protein